MVDTYGASFRGQESESSPPFHSYVSLCHQCLRTDLDLSPEGLDKVFRTSIWYRDLEAYFTGNPAAVDHWSQLVDRAKHEGRRGVLQREEAKTAEIPREEMPLSPQEHVVSPGAPLTADHFAPDSSAVAALPLPERRNDPVIRKSASKWSQKHYSSKYSLGFCRGLCHVLGRQAKLTVRDKEVIG